jgi:protein involved in sex pheromone biosynthesis
MYAHQPVWKGGEIMKKRMLFLIMSLVMILQTAAVFANGEVTTNEVTSNEGSLNQDVELVGKAQKVALFSAIVPTQVNFVVDTTQSNWNKVISPDFYVENLSTSTLKVSIESAAINTPDVYFTSGGYFNGYQKEVQLAIAPKLTYSNWYEVQPYALSDVIEYYYNPYPISLTSGLTANSRATYNIYGDISSNFVNNETFSVIAVFKVALA